MKAQYHSVWLRGLNHLATYQRGLSLKSDSNRVVLAERIKAAQKPSPRNPLPPLAHKRDWTTSTVQGYKHKNIHYTEVIKK